MGNSKIIFDGETLIDLTGDTVSEETLLEGITAHDAAGEPITGKMESPAGKVDPSDLQPKDFFINVVTCDDGSISIDKNYSEISQAYEKGCTLYVIFGEKHIPFADINNSVYEFFFTYTLKTGCATQKISIGESGTTVEEIISEIPEVDFSRKADLDANGLVPLTQLFERLVSVGNYNIKPADWFYAPDLKVYAAGYNVNTESITEGDIISVIWNGTEYERRAYISTIYEDVTALICGGEENDPFAVVLNNNFLEGTGGITVASLSNEEVNLEIYRKYYRKVSEKHIELRDYALKKEIPTALPAQGGHASTADSASSATRAETADNATYAETASKAHEADRANYAITAQYTAGFAVSALEELDERCAVNHNHSYTDLTDLPAIPTKVSELENDSCFLVGDYVPDYFKEHLETKGDEIWQLMESVGRNKSAFLFYTDAHYDASTRVAPHILKWLYRNTPINKTVFGGDIVYFDSPIRGDMVYLHEWRRLLRDLPNHHSVVGDYDDGNEPTDLFSFEYVHSFLLAPEESPDMVTGDGFYYYIDSPCEKTRYLYLDTACEGITDAQLDFVRSALISAPDNWHIIAIAHFWFEPDYDKLNYVPVPIISLSAEVKRMTNIFDSFNKREGDFASCTARIEFCIGGHIHRDFNSKTPGGIPIIHSECECRKVVRSIDTYYTRDEGTKDETAIDAVIADYLNRKVHLIRVGRGSNRVIDLQA